MQLLAEKLQNKQEVAGSSLGGGLAPASRSLLDSGWCGGRVAFWASGLSNRPKRPHLRRAVNVRIIAAKTRDSYLVRFPDEFCKTRQVCNANPNQSRKMRLLMG